MKHRTLAVALALGFGLTAAGEAATKTHVAKARVKGKNRSSNAKNAAKRNKARSKAVRKAHRRVKHA